MFGFYYPIYTNNPSITLKRFFSNYENSQLKNIIL
jgi:hypothetical protein